MSFLNDGYRPILLRYYKSLFPSALIYKWLSYGNNETFSKREIAFTLYNNKYIRFQSFDTHEEFLQKVLEKCPIIINIGAMYPEKPKDFNLHFEPSPEAKELVFDIDITDYDDIRSCCSGSEICRKCWEFLAIGTKIIDCALREDFGFKHILWVFSGRRGIHCWVCDEKVRNSDVEDYFRPAIADFLQIGRKLPDKIHPSLERALSIIDQYFVESIVKEQNILGTNDKLNLFLDFIEDSNVRKQFEDAMIKVTSSLERWEVFETTLEDLQTKGQIPTGLKHLKEEIKLYYSYPRLDIAVTKGLEHLLKTPFSVHRSTGKICIPFSVSSVNNFDPWSVPTLGTVLEELDKYNEDIGNKESIIEEYKKTTLLEPVDLFAKFLENMEPNKTEN